MNIYPSVDEQSAYLVINRTIFSLNKRVITIGRKLDNDLVLDDPMISQYHAEIHQVENMFKIIDLNSMSGTYINKSKIADSILYSGDVILIANIPLMYINKGALVNVHKKVSARIVYA